MSERTGPCAEVQARLDETAFARRAPDSADRAHVAACAACRAHARFLAELVEALDAAPPPAPRPAALAAAHARARKALRTRRLPPGYGRSLVRALLPALAVLPAIIAYDAVVAEAVAALLRPWLPTPLIAWLGVAYVATLGLGFALVFSAIPVLVARTLPSTSPSEGP